ncbi:MAG: flagellar motor protein PomA [Pseudomonadales bacterium]|nr:flagellar motor protein PomA [Pseudomonadales bacterium]
MDLATLLGLVGAFAIVILAMAMGGSVLIFVNVPSIMVVVVGTIFAVLMKFSLKQFLGAIAVAGNGFKFKEEDPVPLIAEIIELAGEARKGGLLSLEGKEVSNDFLKKGITLLIDGHDPDIVREILMKDVSKAQDRHKQGASIFSAFGDVAPAMGMIGTLVGLVQMLSAMDDPKSIGPAMAVALLTTLYGAMIANMFAIPLAGKLELRATEEGRIKTLVIDALIGIQGGQNPKVIEQMLQAYIPEKSRISDAEE